MKQGRTKDEPKNSQLQKVLFIKNPISFTSLIGCSIPPSDDRETTEGTPQQLRTSIKVHFIKKPCLFHHFGHPQKESFC